MNNLEIVKWIASIVKWIADLGPVKQLHVVYLSVIIALGFVVVNRETKTDIITAKSEVREDGKQSKIDSLQRLLVTSEQRHSAEIAAKDKEYMDYLKQSIAEQKKTRVRVKKMGNKVDNVISETKEKLNSEE